MNTLNITENYSVDDSIEEYECHEYEPITGTNLNNTGEIRINIETQDIYTHPSKSYLIMEGRLTKDDGAAYADADVVTLVNNAMMHLFNNIKYQLSGQEIESLRHPGQATTMLGLLKYPDDFSKSQGLNQLWYKDTSVNAELEENLGFKVRHDYIIESPDPKRTFSFRIPLKHIFGFCDDYDKVVYGFKHTLTLVRKSSDDAIYRANDADNGKIVLDKISWFMPHTTPSDGVRNKLYKIIESRSDLPVGFRNRQCDSLSVPQPTRFTWRLGVKSSPEKPRFIIIAFQTNKDNDQEMNPFVFNHVNVKDIHVMLNTTPYPTVDYNISFPKQHISRVYGDAAQFREKYYHLVI